MNVTSTEAQNRPGQLLEQAQVGPVFVEKAGRRYGVVPEIAQYRALLKAGDAVASRN